MATRIDGEFTYWTPRIALKKAVREAIIVRAREELRSTASMIGILLADAVTTPSST